LLGIVVAYLIFWFCSVPDPRFTTPILPLLSVVTAYAIEGAIGYLGWWKKVSRPAFLIAGFLLLITPGWVYAIRALPSHLPPDIPINAEQRENFLTKNLPSYPVYKFLNQRHGSDYTVYTIFNQNMTYYADGLLICALFVPGGQANIFAGDPRDGKLVDGPSLHRFLESLGVDYLLIETYRGALQLPPDNFFRDHFKLVYEQPQLQLYQLSPLTTTEK
jgi:hypothetical protein